MNVFIAFLLSGRVTYGYIVLIVVLVAAMVAEAIKSLESYNSTKSKSKDK